MNAEKRLEFYKTAVRVSHGQAQQEAFQKLADALELEYRRGLSAGYAEGTHAVYHGVDEHFVQELLPEDDGC